MKNCLLTILLSVVTGLAMAQPANNEPCTAASLSVNGGCTGGTNVGSTNVHSSPSCWTASNDVWYRFTASSSAMSVSTDYPGDGSGDLTDTQLAVYRSSDNTCTGTLTQIGCDDNSGTSVALNARVSLTGLTVGNTYFVRVDGFSTLTGDFCIGAFDTPVANELTGSACNTAITVYPNNLACSPANGNSSWNAATWTNRVGTDYCGCDNETNQIGAWSKFTATATSTTISNQTSGGNAEPLDLTIFTGSCAGLTCVSCYSIAKGGSTTFATTVGTTYFVLTTLQAANTSAFRPDICITSAVGCTAPANDACAGAVAVTANTVYQVSPYCATPDLTLCSGSTENNIWYRWTVPAGWTGNAYFQLYDQRCQQGKDSPGMQVSVYNAGATCASITGGTGNCVVYSNTATDEDITLGWSPVAGATYLIAYDGNGGEVCNMSFSIANVVNPVLLPIELLSFSGEKVRNAVHLKWATASETNNDFFMIERTRDGETFELVGKVEGAKNSTTTRHYSLVDTEPYAGTSYYRLRQTDFDGSVKVSQMVPVDFTVDAGFTLDLIPNPASKESVTINVGGAADSRTVITVFDITGKKVFNKEIMLNSAGTGFVEVNNQLQPGLYMVTITDGELVKSSKLVIK